MFAMGAFERLTRTGRAVVGDVEGFFKAMAPAKLP
jgi:hypothetical protein